MRISKMSLWWWMAAWPVWLLVLPVRAQTISPLIVEYREKANGKFQIRNDSLYPLNVVLEPRSFRVDEAGQPIFDLLDTEIQLRLSSMSFRIAPQQTYTVFYQAASLHLPAWFTIYATITGSKAQSGLKLVLELPHTVYLLTKNPLLQESVLFNRAQRSVDGRRIAAEISNRSDEFGRVKEVEVASSSGKKKVYAGFPLFPRQQRVLDLEWSQSGEPQQMIVKFPKFSLKKQIQASMQSP